MYNRVYRVYMYMYIITTLNCQLGIYLYRNFGNGTAVLLLNLSINYWKLIYLISINRRENACINRYIYVIYNINVYIKY